MDAVDPAKYERILVIGAGKAASQMTQVLEDQWPLVDLTGVVVTRYGHGVRCRKIEVLEAAHPTPDEASLVAAQRMLETVEGLTPRDLVICLLTGGGSSLLCALPPGVTYPMSRI